MLQAARAEKKKLRDFDLRADSHEAAFAEMQNHFPAYQFLGTWPRGLRDFCTVRSVFSEKKKLSVAALRSGGGSTPPSTISAVPQ